MLAAPAVGHGLDISFVMAVVHVTHRWLREETAQQGRAPSSRALTFHIPQRGVGATQTQRRRNVYGRPTSEPRRRNALKASNGTIYCSPRHDTTGICCMGSCRPSRPT